MLRRVPTVLGSKIVPWDLVVSWIETSNILIQTNGHVIEQSKTRIILSPHLLIEITGGQKEEVKQKVFSADLHIKLTDGWKTK